MGHQIEAAAMQGKDERFQLLIDSVEDYAIYMLDCAGHIITWNHGAELNEGYTSDEVIGRHFRMLFVPDDAAAGVPEIELAEAARCGRSAGEGWRLRRNGERFWASFVTTAMRDRDGRMVGFAKVTRDLSERKRQEEAFAVMEAALREERDRLHAAAESSMDALFICEAVRAADGDVEDFLFVYLNSNVESLVSISRAALLGKRMCEMLPVNLDLGLFERYKQVVLTGEPLVYEFPVDQAPVKCGWIRVQAVKMRDGLAITASDITERKRDEERISHLAHHDVLTGLPNRSLLRDRLEMAMDRANRYGQKVGVLVVDLDGFKQINDTFGHAAGDDVLVAVAERLRENVRSMDSVMRIGGDEFLVVLPELQEERDLRGCAELLLRELRISACFDGQTIDVTCSIGMAVYPDATQTVEGLLSKADTAMYLAKRQGKGQAAELPPPSSSSGG